MMCSHCGVGNNSNKDANNLLLIQDVISIKSYLQKLRRILHDVSSFYVISQGLCNVLRTEGAMQKGGKRGGKHLKLPDF